VCWGEVGFRACLVDWEDDDLADLPSIKMYSQNIFWFGCYVPTLAASYRLQKP